MSQNLDIIHVSMGVNRSFVRPLAVAIRSLAAIHDPGRCSVTVLHTGIDQEDRRRIEAGAGERLTVSWIPVDTQIVQGVHTSSRVTTAALYRLLLPRILPPEVERTLYLDADTVIANDLGGLWNCDLQGHLAGAVRNAGGPWAAVATDWRDLGLAPGSLYFNSGVLLIPLQAWREEQVAEQALELLRAKTPPEGDQDGLNVVLEGRWHDVGIRNNLQTADIAGRGVGWALWRQEIERAIANPAIVHFTEWWKPWSPGQPHPWSALWFAHLDSTEWAGWRPISRRSSLYRRVGSRARVAARVLLKGADASGHP